MSISFALRERARPTFWTGHVISDRTSLPNGCFAYLAPDIVEAIVEGRQPRSLTVKLLLGGIPFAWPDQRAAFGFSHCP
jgi:hypothetical protein